MIVRNLSDANKTRRLIASPSKYDKHRLRIVEKTTMQRALTNSRMKPLLLKQLLEGVEYYEGY